MKRNLLLLLVGALLISGGVLAWLVWPRPSPQRTAPGPGPGAAAPSPQAVTLYFPNRAYVISGDESLPRFLAEKRSIPPGGNTVLAVLRAMQAGPEDLQATRVIRENLKLRGAKVESDIAYVDFSRVNLSGGSLEEMLMIQGIVRSLTGLKGIKAVQFLVDGKKVDTLMGHISVEQPLSRENLP